MEDQSGSLTENEFITKWSHGADRLYKCRVLTREVSLGPGYVPVRFPTASSSLGQLDHLPAELLGEILEQLDPLSAWQFSRACLLSKAVLEALPKYIQLREGAGIFFQDLRTTQVLSRVSVATLHALLYSEACVSCGAYGPLLHLVDLVRCCYLCVEVNPSLWVAPPSWTQNCFHLDRRLWAQRPLMRSKPGLYGIYSSEVHETSIALTSIGAVKRLALQQYGTMEALAAAHPLSSTSYITVRQNAFVWWREAPLGRLPKDPLHSNPDGIAPRDRFQCMGVVPFPSVSAAGGGEEEHGLFCRACERNAVKYRSRQMCAEERASLVPYDFDPVTFLERARRRAWSRKGFPGHIKAEHPHLLEGAPLWEYICTGDLSS